MLRLFSLLVLCTLFVPRDFLHSQIVVRDSIGPESSMTDGMPGGSTVHDGSMWNTPGIVIDIPTTGVSKEARFVIFAFGDDLAPENNIVNVLGLPVDFHVWSDGIQGGADSFDENPNGGPAPGHVELCVNSAMQSFITAQAWGLTGPLDAPDMFTTFSDSVSAPLLYGNVRRPVDVPAVFFA